jgi:HEAT repeat protein
MNTGRFPLFAWAALLLCNSGQATAADSVESTWRKPPLRFDLVVHNPNHQKACHLLQIGVTSDVQGTFNCLGGATALKPIADYVVSFRLNDNRTLLDADPPIEIMPLGSARFTIALYPDDHGACGPWTSKVTALMVFEGGVTLASETEQIDSASVAASAKRPLSLGDITAASRHRNPLVRQWASGLLAPTHDPAALDILSRGLSDPSPDVRRAALQAIAKSSDGRLGSKLLDAAKQSSDWQELPLYCDALGGIHYAPASEFLLSVLLRAEPASIPSATQALRALPPPSVVPALNTALAAHADWGTEAAWPTAQSLAYRGIIDLLFEFADPSSAEALKDLLVKTTNADLRNLLLLHVQQKAATAFSAGFRPALDMLARDGSASVQRSVLPVLVAVAPMPEKPTILKSFLGKTDSFTRAAACTVTAQVALPALVPQITDLAARAQPGAERLACCHALQVLGVKDACPE